MITVTCSCGRRLRAKDELAGNLAQCPHCQERVLIPDGVPFETEAAGPTATAVAAIPATRSRTRLLVGGGVLVAVLGVALVVYLGWFRGKTAPATGHAPDGGSPVAG